MNSIVIKKNVNIYVQFISYSKCSNWRRISKLSSNFLIEPHLNGASGSEKFSESFHPSEKKDSDSYIAGEAPISLKSSHSRTKTYLYSSY